VKFKNPVLSGFYPDASICRVGDDFYMITSTFEYFPGVPIFKSKNLVDWEQIGHCLDRDSQIDLRDVKSSGGIFAPTLRYNNGKFYMVTTEVDKLGHFYVTAKNPEGPWSDPIQVEGKNFDPDLFFDNDGKVYFSYMGMGEGIKQFEIDIETGKIISEERVIWKGFEDPFCEAPHLYKIGSWYYLLVAEGGTHRTHMIVCARSKSPKGPFESCPYNPILTHRCAIFNPIYHAGHGDFIQYTDGSWWVVFLGVRTVKSNFHLGRETFLAPVKWTDDEWPLINDGEYVQLEMDAGNLPVKKQKPSSFILLLKTPSCGRETI
jgi:xylan 1,4-beta-xylosidase